MLMVVMVSPSCLILQRRNSSRDDVARLRDERP